MTIAAGRGADQFMVRFPPGLRERLRLAAQASNRSMNSEVVFHLERALLGDVAATGAMFGDGAPAAAGNPADVTSVG